MADFTMMSNRRRIRIIRCDCWAQFVSSAAEGNGSQETGECEDEKEILREYFMTIVLRRVEKLDF